MSRPLGTALVIAAGCLAASAAHAQMTKCTMEFMLVGWSAFYKTASGTGTVTCDNGSSTAVTIRTKGGGLTVGKSKVVGHGKFSPVSDVAEIFGSYAAAEAHAGAGPSSAAQALTKGTVSLELTGSGQGVDLGFSFGSFTISKAGAAAKGR